MAFSLGSATRRSPLSGRRKSLGRSGASDLAAAELELASEVGREIILQDKLDEDSEEFDSLILDCPPSLGVLTLNALTAAGEVFLPLQPHFLALHGLSKLLRTIELVARRLNPTLRLTGIVYCMYESSTRLAAEVTTDVEDFFESLNHSESVWAGPARLQHVPAEHSLAEAPSFGQSIFDYSASSMGAEDYEQLREKSWRAEIRLPTWLRRPMLDPCRTLSTDAGHSFLKWQACFAFVRSDLASPWGCKDSTAS